MISWQLGIGIILFFVISLILTLVLHALARPTRAFSLFAALYLAGTIIVGGGPVVIPLLREYVVDPGRISPRDFLLAVAIQQALPGPTFNIGVYLGSLAVAGTVLPSVLGAAIAFVGMYALGLLIAVGLMGLWRFLRHKKWFLSVLRGVSAAAVGLVITAVYRFWQMRGVTDQSQGGEALGTDPWLVAICSTACVGGAWFSISAPVAILLGVFMGVARFGVMNM